MSNSELPEPQSRSVGGTEFSWCKAVPGGTGITVLALLLSKPPDFSFLRNALHNIQNSHPILRSKLHFNATTSSFSFIIPTNPSLEIKPFDLPSTSHILQAQSGPENHSTSPFHLIIEHELNQNSWSDSLNTDIDVFFASVYTLSETQWAVVLRLHTSACDRTAAVAVLRELLGFVGKRDERIEEGGKVSLGIEDLIPNGKCNKAFWARGVDLLGYSLNSFRLSNLEFVDSISPRSSQVVRLQINPHDTHKLLAGCKSRGIKLWGALVAAGLIAAHSCKRLLEHQWEKYAVVTLIDCRSVLEPPLIRNSPGFYHSAILNTHNVNGGETLWELATRTNMAFTNAKNCNKHFSDMSDLNFLMCKAIENPGLTPSVSLRTSIISVFEDPVIDDSNEMHEEIGLVDYIGCASVHGVGPSIAVFDTIRDGGLDCACVYPWPLHSREQMSELIAEMKRILVDSSNDVGNAS